MIPEHWFWWLLTMACVVWYSTITVYVAFRGFFDIKHMLSRLADAAQSADSMEPLSGNGSTDAGPGAR